MRIIQFLHSAGAISVVFGKGNEDLRNDNHNHNLRRLQGQSITCDLTAGETPCHSEKGVIHSCVKTGEMCPCFGAEHKCTSPRFGEYCDTTCCDWDSQERCHVTDPSDPMVYDVWCADVSDGGCPCFDGEVKCGATEGDGGHPGHCASLCCEEGVEQMCYDENYDPSHCASIAEGGCSCPRGQEKCGAREDWAGYCTAVCCDVEHEETCYDERGRKSCSQILRGGCLHGTSYTRWEPRVASTILAKGTGSQVSYYSAIKNRRSKLLAEENSSKMQEMVKHLEAEEAALFHAIRLGGRKRLANEEVITAFSRRFPRNGTMR